MVSATHKLKMKLKNFLLRGKNGWCPQDTWSLDVYLANVISESIKYLKKHTISYPDGMTFKEWKRVLKTISEGINAPYRLDESVNNMANFNKQSKIAYEKQKEALKLFVKYFDSLWD